jgi:predicted nucleic acid-binding protein
MTSAFTTFIDANVFYGARLRSLVLFVAQAKLFRVRWSERVHDEWVRNLITNRPDLRPADLARTRAAMNAAVADCLVDGYEALVDGIVLPDPDDRHIVAAALVARAEVIVTFNDRDFPKQILSGLRLRTKHPDMLLMNALHRSRTAFLDAVKADFSHYRHPPLVYGEYLERLANAGVPRLARELEAWAPTM